MISADTQSPSYAADDDEGFEIRREPSQTGAAEQPRRQRRKGKHKRAHRAANAADALARAGVDPREQILTVAQNAAAEIRKRPALAIAAAVGVGFVIGGALSMRLGRAALAAAGRWAMKRLTASF